jgi:hypothetical protein
LSVTLKEPVNQVSEAGVNVTDSVQLWPAFRLVPQVVEATVKLPPAVMVEIVTAIGD